MDLSWAGKLSLKRCFYPASSASVKPEDDKARIVKETLAPGGGAGGSKPRTSQQVFMWRREARERAKKSGAVMIES